MKSSKKIKICYLIWNTRKCGGNKIIFEHCNRLALRGHQVEIFSFRGSLVDWFPVKTKINSFMALGWLKGWDVTVATFWPTAYLAVLVPARKKFYFVQNWELNFYRSPVLSFLVRLTF